RSANSSPPMRPSVHPSFAAVFASSRVAAPMALSPASRPCFSLRPRRSSRSRWRSVATGSRLRAAAVAPSNAGRDKQPFASARTRVVPRQRRPGSETAFSCAAGRARDEGVDVAATNEKTRFTPVGSSFDLPELEHGVLDLWERERTFEALKKQNAGGPRYSFIDGPITANVEAMGVHHAWGRTYKDLYQRYQAMQGHELRWQSGFDCQGLWVEVQVERELSLNSKRDIESYGIDRFSRACRARVDRSASVITKHDIRLGRWMNWDDSYFTYTDNNIS